MPRSKRQPKNRIVRPAELSAVMREFLLDGWTYTEPPGSDSWEPYDYTSEADLAALWKAHEPELLAEWERRGRPGRPFGEHLAAERSTTS